MSSVAWRVCAVALWLPVVILVVLPAWPWSSLPGHGLDLTLNLLVWCAVALLALCAGGFLLRRRPRGGPVAVWLWGGALLMCLPWLWTPAIFRPGALYRLAGLWAMAGLLWLLLQIPVRGQMRRRVYAVVLLAGLVQAALAVWQGSDPASASEWLHYSFAGADGRALGGMMQANLLGSLLATALGCALMLALPCRGRGAYGSSTSVTAECISDINDFRSGSRLFLPTLLPWLLLPVFVAALTLSHSRSAQAAAMLTTLLLLLLVRCGLRPRLLALTLLLGGVLAGQGLLMLQPARLDTVAVSAVGAEDTRSQDVVTRLAENRRASDRERLSLLRGSMGLINAHLLGGNGLGSFETAFPTMLARLHQVNPFPLTVLYPHNEVLYVWSEGGLVALSGLVLWLILVWQPFRTLFSGLLPVVWRRRGPWPGRRVAARGVLLLPLGVHIMSEYPLYHSAVHVMLLLLLLWLALPARCRRPLSPSAAPLSRGLVVPAVGLSLATAMFMATGLQSAAQLREAEAFSLMDPAPLDKVMNPYAQPDRLRFDRAISALMQFNQTRDRVWLDHFVYLAEQWQTLHNDANLTFSLERLAMARGNSIQAAEWRLRGCLSFYWDPRFACGVNFSRPEPHHE